MNVSVVSSCIRCRNTATRSVRRSDGSAGTRLKRSHVSRVFCYIINSTDRPARCMQHCRCSVGISRPFLVFRYHDNRCCSSITSKDDANDVTFLSNVVIFTLSRASSYFTSSDFLRHSYVFSPIYTNVWVSVSPAPTPPCLGQLCFSFNKHFSLISFFDDSL